MNRRALAFPVMLALLFTGCTYKMKLAVPAVANKEPTVARKGTAALGAIEDKRPADTRLFIFFNGIHTWIFEGDKKPEEVVGSLLKEGLRRCGIEAGEAGAPLTVTAQILDFSGQNEMRALYAGGCDYKISVIVKIAASTGEKTFTVTGTGKDNVGLLNSENVVFLMNLTYDDFLKKLDTELANAGY